MQEDIRKYKIFEKEYNDKIAQGQEKVDNTMKELQEKKDLVEATYFEKQVLLSMRKTLKADKVVFDQRKYDMNKEFSFLNKQLETLRSDGMEVSEQKTKITATTEGFDFLGWNFKVQNNEKFRNTPSEANFKAFRKKVKAIINNSNHGATVKATKLAPIVRGWRNSRL